MGPDRSAGVRPGVGADDSPTPARGRLHLAFEDPLSALPETAQKLLLAAKEIIATEGFDALTLNAVSARSGENKAMISYYFGNKAGLVAAVVDSVVHDEYVSSRSRMSAVEPRQRARRLTEEMRRVDAASEEFRVFFELLPHVLRDDTLRRRIALLYRWYWSVKLEWLGITGPAASLDNPELLGRAQILSAVIDGLAIQCAIDPELDLTTPYRIFQGMLEASLLAAPDGKTGTDGSVASGDGSNP